jgi:hypothetical protein
MRIISPTPARSTSSLRSRSVAPVTGEAVLDLVVRERLNLAAELRRAMATFGGE